MARWCSARPRHAHGGLPNHEAIAAAKAGIEGLNNSAAATYASRGIRINCVAPGLVRSGLTARICGNAAALKVSLAMHPLGRIGEPDDVARVIEFLLDPANSWMTAQVIGVDGVSALPCRGGPCRERRARGGGGRRACGTLVRALARRRAGARGGSRSERRPRWPRADRPARRVLARSRLPGAAHRLSRVPAAARLRGPRPAPVLSWGHRAGSKVASTGSPIRSAGHSTRWAPWAPRWAASPTSCACSGFAGELSRARSRSLAPAGDLDAGDAHCSPASPAR